MNIEWMVIRGSGIVAFALLAASSIWGLLITTKVLGRAVKAKPVTWFHESLGLGALIATGVHMVALTMDDYIEFGWRDVLVPGSSSWQPLAVSFGVMGFYGLAIVALSFYVKGTIGQNAWRSIHFLAFGTFLAVLVHAFLAGTDSAHPAVAALYIASAALVAMLMAIRVVQQRSAARTGDGRRTSSRSRDALDQNKVATRVGD